MKTTGDWRVALAALRLPIRSAENGGGIGNVHSEVWAVQASFGTEAIRKLQPTGAPHAIESLHFVPIGTIFVPIKAYEGITTMKTENGSVSEAVRIAKFMGLPHWEGMDDMGLVERVRKGFPARTATVVVERIDPHGRFVRATDIIPKSSLHRRKDQPLTKDQSEKVWALSKVFSEILRVYHGDSDQAAHFLVRKHPMLAGRQPIELAIESIAGADLVLKLLAQADAGVAA